ncbi:hypothetical protein Peur_039646 [Populus x canadensis]
MDEASIVIFKDRNGWYPNAIVFYLSHIQPTKALKKFNKSFKGSPIQFQSPLPPRMLKKPIEVSQVCKSKRA